MKEIKVFVANDGKIFANLEDCKKYEKNDLFRKEVEGVLKSFITPYRFENLTRGITDIEKARLVILKELAKEIIENIEVFKEIINYENNTETVKS